MAVRSGLEIKSIQLVLAVPVAPAAVRTRSGSKLVRLDHRVNEPPASVGSVEW